MEFVVKRIRVRLQSVYWGNLCCHKGKGNLFAVIYELPPESISPVSFFTVRATLDLSKKDGRQENLIPPGSADEFFCAPNSCRSLHLTLSCPSANEERAESQKKRHFLIFQKPNSLMTPTKRMWAGRVHIILRQPNHLAFELWGGKKCEKLPELEVPDTLDQCRGDVWILRIRCAVIEWALTTGLHLWWFARKHWIRKKKWRFITLWLTMTDVERNMPSAQLIA